MAFSLSTSPTFFCTSFPTTPSKSSQYSTKSTFLPFHFPSKSHNLFSISNPILNYYQTGSPAIYCPQSSQQDSNHYVNEGEQEGQGDEETAETSPRQVWESVDSLTKYFKEAVLAGDHQTIAEIETTFYRLESEKNELVEKVSTSSEEITAGKERYIRLQADFDNYRKISEKERVSVRSDAQGEVIESLLPMVDNFERAKQQLKPETEREKQIDTSYQGIYKQFVELMRSLQVAVIATVGKPFDPTLHEAIAREESEEFKEGVVIQEFRRGFLLGDRLLRPAMVKVSSGPGTKKDTATAKTSAGQTSVSPSADERSAAAAGVDEL